MHRTRRQGLSFDARGALLPSKLNDPRRAALATDQFDLVGRYQKAEQESVLQEIASRLG